MQRISNIVPRCGTVVTWVSPFKRGQYRRVRNIQVSISLILQSIPVEGTIVTTQRHVARDQRNAADVYVDTLVFEDFASFLQEKIGES